ncbi:MAG: NifB/NifX family molybdenum-iron cluster-binding protein [Candidatus Heimdallarchaeota archaeon]
MMIVLLSQNKGLDSKVSSHYGRAMYLALINEETLEVKEIIKNGNHHYGGVLSPPKYYATLGTIVIAKGIGANALHSSKNFGLIVYLGAKDTLGETIESYKTNQLRLAEDGDPEIHPSDVVVQKKVGQGKS